MGQLCCPLVDERPVQFFERVQRLTGAHGSGRCDQLGNALEIPNPERGGADGVGVADRLAGLTGVRVRGVGASGEAIPRHAVL